jgi:hypothetical protein
MKVNRVFLVATAAAISAVAIPSCAYQPQYSNSSYSSGYGYGYGSRNFTTTHFVRTNNTRWGYDPYARCYYDYSRRCYYDPYLSGYYPVGYRPAYVYGTPHPHGWRTGRNCISPPSHFHDHRLDNYQNRSERYRSLNNDWSRNIQSTSSSRSHDSNRDRYPSHDQSHQSRSGSFFGTSQGNQPSHSNDRSLNAYVNDTQDDGHLEPRMSEPKDESPRAPRKEKVNREERDSRSNREANPKKERSGRKGEFEMPGAMRQPEHRGGNRLRNQENRRNEQPANKSSENVDERIVKRS